MHHQLEHNAALGCCCHLRRAFIADWGGLWTHTWSSWWGGVAMTFITHSYKYKYYEKHSHSICGIRADIFLLWRRSVRGRDGRIMLSHRRWGVSYIHHEGREVVGRFNWYPLWAVPNIFLIGSRRISFSFFYFLFFWENLGGLTCLLVLLNLMHHGVKRSCYIYIHIGRHICICKQYLFSKTFFEIEFFSNLS